MFKKISVVLTAIMLVVSTVLNPIHVDSRGENKVKCKTIKSMNLVVVDPDTDPHD
ncbi:hypothetical protein [Oceanirhabdus sp. W0125-5]|uniref:hypothetical protein n=1 Tax=Oceanirhabdus sp. W0125-5 TaxID=2999116 RepID=UPI0022F341A2|nr:hypothetical protein [Oceanirhabdus sp. W0125-5]WBW96775.1 hypothetical protein OW730_24245 [Oceanirhabdus sp. W0125-5]